MKKGPQFEKDVVEYLRERLGGDYERRVMGGRNDRGDVAGLTYHGHPFVVEAKNVTKLRPATWYGELETECANAQTELGAVVFHREGHGRASMGQQGVLMTLDTLCTLLGS